VVLHAVFTSIGAHFGVLLLSLSLLALATFVGMMTSVTSCFISTYVVRVPYFSQKLAIEIAAGTTCGECGTDTTSKWINCKDEPRTKICTSCYQKNQRNKKKAASANEA
jgi:hypothetical protein